jgi:hypothetical protein
VLEGFNSLVRITCGANESAGSPPEVRSACPVAGADAPGRRRPLAEGHSPRSRLGHRHPLRAIGSPRASPPTSDDPPVELAKMSARRALIVVDPRSIRSVPGVSVIPVAAGRAFLAFDPGRGLADLELAAVDGLDPTTNAAERSAAAARPRLASLWTLPILDPVDHPRRAQLQARPRALTVSEARQQPGWAIKSS